MNLQVEANFICPTCFESVMSHYTFREKVFKNLKLRTEGDCNPIQNDIKKFLNKLSEPANVVIYQDVLSIIPNSVRQRFNSRVKLHEIFCPSVQLEVEDIEDLKAKLKKEVKAEDEVTTIEGIFGDDDFYRTNQFLSDACKGPSTSGTSLKRKSSAPVESERNKMPCKPFYDDEALDTSGESSSECPSIVSVVQKKYTPKKSPKISSNKPIVVSKSVNETDNF